MRILPLHRNGSLADDGLFLLQRLAYAAAGFVLFAVGWFLVGEILFDRPAFEQFSDLLPLPTLRAFVGLAGDPHFWSSVAASLRRVLVGIFLALAIGLPVGLCIGYFRLLRDLANTPIQLLRMISPLAWMPIALLIFPSFESAITFLMTMATVWPIILNTALGVSRLRPAWLEMARNQGANDRQLLVKVVFPATLPYLFTSLRLALGIAWIIIVPVEFLGVSSGLGYLINDARDTLEYDRLMAVVLAIGVLGYCLDTAITAAQRFFGWTWAD